MKQLTPEEIVETLAKAGTDEWNKALSDHLEPVRAYFSADEWGKAIAPHLKAILGHAISRMLSENLSHDSYQYLRGFAAGLRLVLSLPASVEGEIVRKYQADSSKPGPYTDI